MKTLEIRIIMKSGVPEVTIVDTDIKELKAIVYSRVGTSSPWYVKKPEGYTVYEGSTDPLTHLVSAYLHFEKETQKEQHLANIKTKIDKLTYQMEVSKLELACLKQEYERKQEHQ